MELSPRFDHARRHRRARRAGGTTAGGQRLHGHPHSRRPDAGQPSDIGRGTHRRSRSPARPRRDPGRRAVCLAVDRTRGSESAGTAARGHRHGDRRRRRMPSSRIRSGGGQRQLPGDGRRGRPARRPAHRRDTQPVDAGLGGPRRAGGRHRLRHPGHREPLRVAVVAGRRFASARWPKVAAAGISVIALPHTNLFLQGRDCQVAMPRAVSPR